MVTDDMGELYTSPSFHQISPLTRSRSDVRSQALKRSNSYAGLIRMPSTLTVPQYGYGGGFMARSLSRSGSTMFGRTLTASALTKTAPFTNVGVQRSTPHYHDKYPYVRYSYGNPLTPGDVRRESDQLYRYSTGLSNLNSKRLSEGRTTTFSSLYKKPNYYNSRMERPVAPVRTYVRYMPTDDAVDLFKKGCMNVSTLSKYWLSSGPNYSSRGEYDLNMSTNYAGRGQYYRNHSFNTARSFASRLYSRVY
ncbi:unnamed protein product, partial [Mesorhabditis spiculigera]